MPCTPLRISDIADDFAADFIDDHHVRAARNVNAVRIGIHPEVVPTAVAADRHSSDHVIATGLRRGIDSNRCNN